MFQAALDGISGRAKTCDKNVGLSFIPDYSGKITKGSFAKFATVDSGRSRRSRLVECTARLRYDNATTFCSSVLICPYRFHDMLVRSVALLIIMTL